MLKKMKSVFGKDKSPTTTTTTTTVFYDEDQEVKCLEETSNLNGKKDVQKRHSPKSQIGKSVFYSEEKTETIQQVHSLNQSKVLWAESEAVLCSGILDNMTMYEQALQETKFEIITTELRHLNSLNMLIAIFYQCKPLSATCTPEEWDSIFGNIRIVKDASELLLSDLLVHWQNDILLSGIYAILRNHATSILRVYVNYCSNQPQANLTLKTLIDNNKEFRNTLLQIEEIQNETLQTFLTLPIQRVTRMPLLLEAVISRLDQTKVEYTACRLAISTFKQLAKECNEAVAHHHKLVESSSEEQLSVKSDETHNADSNQQNQPRRKLNWSTSSSWSI